MVVVGRGEDLFKMIKTRAIELEKGKTVLGIIFPRPPHTYSADQE